MLHDYLNILVLFLVVALGYLITRAKWIDDASNKTLTRLLLSVALPATLVLSIGRDYTKKEFLHLLPNIWLPALVILIMMVLSWLVSLVMQVKASHRGLFIGVCSMSSTIMFGIPISIAVYGSHGLPFALMTYAAQTVIYWTIGLYLLEKDATDSIDKNAFVKKMVKEIFNMPLIAFFVGICILLFGLAIPKFLNEFLSYLSGMTSGLAMLVVGSIIFLTGFHGFKITKELIVVVCFRFIVAPLLTYVLGIWMAVPTEMLKVTMLIVSLPIPNTTVILAKKYNTDVQFATEALTFSIAVYLLFLPIILYAIHSF